MCRIVAKLPRHLMLILLVSAAVSSAKSFEESVAEVAEADRKGGIEAAAAALPTGQTVGDERVGLFELRIELADRAMSETKFELARRLYAAAMAEAGNTIDEMDLSYALRGQAEAERQLGHVEASVALLDRAHALEMAVIGRSDPNLRFVTSELASASAAAGNTQRARLLAVQADNLEKLAVSNRIALEKAGSGDNSAYEIVPVYFATNRAKTGLANPLNLYGSVSADVTMGVAYVSLPRARRIGKIPLPAFYRLDFRSDPRRHVVVKELVLQDATEFRTSLATRVNGSSRKEALVYIHGYKSSFTDAVQRAAQLAVDLRIDGAAVAYSWPSKNALLQYSADEDEADKLVHQEALAALLQEVRDKTGAQHVYVISHSLGNRLTLKALEMMKSGPMGPNASAFDAVVFASADVNADDFQVRVSRLGGAARHFTLYASSDDNALLVSGKLHARRRAGDANQKVPGTDLLEVVDSTNAKTDFIGHSDYAFLAADDLAGIIWNNLPANQRCILSAADSTRWRYNPQPSCSPIGFRTAMAYLRVAGSKQAALQQLSANIVELPESLEKSQLIQARQIIDVLN